MNSALKYYIYLDEQVQGPYDLDFINSMNLSSDLQVCPEGSTDWVELGSISNFLSASGDFNDTQPILGMSDSPPDSVGKYKIIRELGRGGMGSVYLANDEILNRYVAIKELKIDEQKKKDIEAYSLLSKRFKKEAQVLAQLNHKNIVSIFDIVESNQNQYIIMEYLDGKNLEFYLEEYGQLEISKAVSIVVDTCLALDYIHKKNIIHRDVKPSNIVILEDGVVKLTDFGVTRDMNSMTVTKDGSLVGTIAYASPEQDSRDLDGRSDVFSLGVVLYELVTGKKPFTGETIASVLLQIATKDPIKPSDINPKVDKMLESIINKAMTKSLTKRYSSAMEMYDDLQKYQEALEKNDLKLLNSDIRTPVANLNVKLDSIPPGKFQLKDFVGKSAPSVTKPSPIINSNISLSEEKEPAKIAELENSLSKPEKVELLKEEKNAENLTEQSLADSNVSHSEPKKDSVNFNKNNELNNTPKINNGDSLANEKIDSKLNISPISDELLKNKKDVIKEYLWPVSVPLFILIFFIGINFNLFDILLSGGILLSTVSEYKNKETNKIVSFFLMFLGIFSITFAFKNLLPAALDNENVQSSVYYIIDLAFLLLSFAFSYVVLRILNSFLKNNQRFVCAFAGFTRSFLASLGIIITLSSTSIVDSSFLRNQLRHSDLSASLSSFVPDFESGRRIDVVFSRFGLTLKKK